MLIATTCGIEVHETVVDDWQRGVLDQDREGDGDGVGERSWGNCACCGKTCESQGQEDAKLMIHLAFGTRLRL